jgi:multidrug transporter EmrE-like cation transporter
MGHLYIALTLLFTVYGQLVIKWQISQSGALPPDLAGKMGFLLGQLANPWIVSGFASAFLAALAWMAAMTQFELSYAYPFMSLAFVLVMAFSIAFLGEPLTLSRGLGTLLVVAGLAILAR